MVSGLILFVRRGCSKKILIRLPTLPPSIRPSYATGAGRRF